MLKKQVLQQNQTSLDFAEIVFALASNGVFKYPIFFSLFFFFSSKKDKKANKAALRCEF